MECWRHRLHPVSKNMTQYEEMEKQQKELMDSINQEKTNLENAVKETTSAVNSLSKIKKEIEENSNELISAKTRKEKINNDIREININIGNSKIDLDNINSDISIKSVELSKLTEQINSLSADFREKVQNANIEYEKNTEINKNKYNDSLSKLKQQDNDIERNNEKSSSLSKTIETKSNELIVIDDLISSRNSDLTKLNYILEESRKNYDNIKNEKNDFLSKINGEIDVANELLSNKGKDIKEIIEKQEEEKIKLEQIIKKGADLISREDYVNSQEIYLKEQFKRLGLEYQPYVRN